MGGSVIYLRVRASPVRNVVCHGCSAFSPTARFDDDGSRSSAQRRQCSRIIAAGADIIVRVRALPEF